MKVVGCENRRIDIWFLKRRTHGGRGVKSRAKEATINNQSLNYKNQKENIHKHADIQSLSTKIDNTLD